MSTSSSVIETSNLDQGLWSGCETLLHWYLEESWRDSRYRSNDILYLPSGPSLTSLSDNCHSGQVVEVDRHQSLWILLSRRFYIRDILRKWRHRLKYKLLIDGKHNLRWVNVLICTRAFKYVSFEVLLFKF